MTNEASSDAHTADALPVPPSGDQAGAVEPPVEASPAAPAESVSEAQVAQPAPEAIEPIAAPAPDSAPEAVIAALEHSLVRLEEAFLVEWHKMFTGMDNDAKKLLAWVASQLP